MNFILNNKLVIFFIFIIFYCLFNYQLKEGLAPSGQIKVDRATGIATHATASDVSARNAIEANAMETREINEAEKEESMYDREKAMGAAGRLVENIDGEKGQAVEQAAAEEMKSIVKTGSRPLMPTPDQRAADTMAAENSLAAVSKVKETVKKLQDDAMARSKSLTRELQSFGKSALKATPLAAAANPYGLASQGEGFNGVVGAGNEVAGSTKNSRELIKQRDRVASRLGCKERCRHLYDDQTDYVCDSGNCICKVKKDNTNFSDLPGSSPEGNLAGMEATLASTHQEHSAGDEVKDKPATADPPPTKSSAAEPTPTITDIGKVLHKGAVCVGIGDNKVLLKEWYDGNRMLPPPVCATKCKETEGCKFYSSRESDAGACMLYSNCPKQRSDGGYAAYNVYAAPTFAKEKALHEGAVCVGYADNKVLLKEWYGAQKWPPSACKAKCKETEGCKFYSSRLNDNGACMLYSNCPKQRSDGGYKGYNVYAVGDTEGFRSGFSIPEVKNPEYIYRVHGECKSTELEHGEA